MKFLPALFLLFCAAALAQNGYQLITPENVKRLDVDKACVPKLTAVDSVFEEFLKYNNREIENFYKTHKTTAGFKLDQAAITGYVNNLLDNEGDETVKRFAAFKFLSCLVIKFNPGDSTLYKKCFAIVKPADDLFSLDDNSVFKYAAAKANLNLFACYSAKDNSNGSDDRLNGKLKTEKELTSAYEEFLEKNKNRNVQARALLNVLNSNSDSAVIRKYYQILKNRYADIEGTLDEIKQYDPDAPVQTGKIVPEFNVKLFDGEKYISSKTLKGKYYLVLFWGSSCLNSVFMLEALAKAYDKYKDKNFTAITVSEEDSAETIRKFQDEKYPMPWYNIVKDEAGKLLKIFDDGGAGIPRSYFVSPEGKFLTLNKDICAGSLESVVSEYLDEAK
jgi:thiol-disulfide isomerase/thioredoxin